MKSLQKLTTVKDRIIRFLIDDDILLTSDEDKILARWEHADKMMRQGVIRHEIIIDAIADKFNVSKKTADKDIINAMEVFGKSRKMNKIYLGHLHLQDIAEDIQKWRAKIFGKVQDEDAKGKKVERDYDVDSKEIMALAKLHDAYTYQKNSLPSDDKAPVIKRPVFIFNSVGGQQIKAPMSVYDAMAKADEYINYETVKTANDGNDQLG